MKIANLIALVGLLAMTLVIAYASASGNFAEEGAWLISHHPGLRPTRCSRMAICSLPLHTFARIGGMNDQPYTYQPDVF